MTAEPITSELRGGVSARDQAGRAASAAAANAGLTIAELDDVEAIHEVARLFNTVWSMSGDDPLIPANTLRALSHSGNYVAGAYAEDHMIGAIVGFLGRLNGALQLHSHILGVSPRLQGRSVGFALKQHQRAWALDHGIATVTWTFDPLVRRNAYFNIAKLGATVRAFYPDFYGAMNDGINEDDESDRVLIEWDLGAPAVVAASEGHPLDLDLRALQDDGAVVVLEADADGGPVATERRERTLLVTVPEDIVRVRGESATLAKRWRAALRDVLGGALNDGYTAAGMTRSGWYVLRSSS